MTKNIPIAAQKQDLAGSPGITRGSPSSILRGPHQDFTERTFPVLSPRFHLPNSPLGNGLTTPFNSLAQPIGGAMGEKTGPAHGLYGHQNSLGRALQGWPKRYEEENNEHAGPHAARSPQSVRELSLKIATSLVHHGSQMSP